MSDAGHFDVDRGVRVHAAADHLGADAARNRLELAGEQRFIETALAGVDTAVGRYRLAGAHADPVTDREFAQGDVFFLAVGDAQRGGRQHTRQRTGRA